mmetsp:Transcript_470/g.1142  ORF Transcript_470/g.1142 Transcript_470/m.1142 type:complete len:84 (+) Transcript_470:645-896(+)|eukprot:CAMPEP_0171502842 /NCGR_PEP_ID=MMETSP0958-20121227/10461_1 /TAXON_ID=87120 /ORGANISM="Aurantiochytrium limacinum, Strain ATCCMYA-1381" /LENGTH=83 /DNA_ID=CAMNT_0012038059 /DNA_START=588 /DNA_END=839 /DNA_ORIENTATION=+
MALNSLIRVRREMWQTDAKRSRTLGGSASGGKFAIQLITQAASHVNTCVGVAKYIPEVVATPIEAAFSQFLAVQTNVLSKVDD